MAFRLPAPIFSSSAQPLASLRAFYPSSKHFNSSQSTFQALEHFTMRFTIIIAALACFAVAVQANLVQVLLTYNGRHFTGRELRLGFDLNECTIIEEGTIVKSVKALEEFHCTVYKSADCHGRHKAIHRSAASLPWNPRSFKCVFAGLL